jgi:hypothetical protein
LIEGTNLEPVPSAAEWMSKAPLQKSALALENILSLANALACIIREGTA